MIYQTHISKDVSAAAEWLQQNHLVAIPTETVYGLAANAFNEIAVQKIFDTKQRPAYNPLIVHIGNIGQLSSVAAHVPSVAQTLLEVFSPGPLTVLLPKKDNIPSIVTANLANVAVRIPNHSLALTLLNQLPFPLAAPSANKFGYISPTQPSHVLKQFDGEIPMILDGGLCTGGIESTVVGFNELEEPVIYRQGIITAQDIINVTGICHVKPHEHATVIESPGMIPFHYSPNTKMLVVPNLQEAVSNMPELKKGIISFNTTIQPSHSNDVCVQLSPQNNLNEAARNLYAAMHRLDEKNLEIIIAELLPNEGIGAAINEKINKAAAKTNAYVY